MENLKKIMLVDDDPSVTTLLKTKFEKTGKFSVVFTNKSKQALELANTEKPDLIICDIEMPGVDGGDVARAIFDDEETKDIPLLFCSSLVMPSDTKDGMVGKQHMMSKSSPFKDLLAKVESMLSTSA
ncbi:MAG: response regulator [Desulfamplus sp.]|nr:response regulator [Desulfamplus sp.]